MTELFCACVGSEVRLYSVDETGIPLIESISLDAPIQYACANDANGVSYFVTSDGGPFDAGSRHHLHILAPTGQSPSLAPLSAPVPLPSRPIHIALDATGEHVLVSFNRPPEFALFALDAEGRVTTRTQSETGLGIAPHQGLISPDNRMLIISERGNNAIGTCAPISGAMRIFDYQQGRAAHRQTVTAPWEGGFEPRNVLYHPDKELVYLVLESQNQLLVYQRHDVELAPQPVQIIDLLAAPGNAQRGQIAGAVKMNHAKTRLYAANRAHGHTLEAGMRVFAGGENNIAHYSLDQATGLLDRGGHVAVNGIGPRNLSISADDRWLVASSWMAHLIKTPDGSTRRTEAGFDVYELDASGIPHHKVWVPVETAATTLFWTGFLPIGQASRLP